MTLQKFKRIFLNLFSIIQHKNTKFLFCSPKKSEILILDSIDEVRLSAAILHGMNYAVLDTRYAHDRLEFKMHLSFKILYIAMCMLIKGGRLWDAYCYAVICCAAPKVIIDNIHFPFLLPLAKKIPNANFFIILNGFQFNLLDRNIVNNSYIDALKELFQRDPQRVSNVHIFCFGKKDSDIFRQRGLDEATTGIQYHDIGTLFGDYMKSLMCGNINKNDYDIVFVSQCEQDSIMGNEQFHKIMVKNTSKVIANLNRYITETGQRCLILLRGRPNSEASEIAFYRSLLDESARVEFHRNDSAFAVYEGLAKAPIIVSLYSTTGFEAMAWGKKVLFCLYGFTKIYKISSDRYQSDTDMLRWSLENSEYSVFKKCLVDLAEINLSDYLAQNAEATSYIVSGSSGKPAHVYIREMLLSKLGQAQLH